MFYFDVDEYLATAPTNELFDLYVDMYVDEWAEAEAAKDLTLLQWDD